MNKIFNAINLNICTLFLAILKPCCRFVDQEHVYPATKCRKAGKQSQGAGLEER